MDFDISKLIKNVTKIKLSGGIFGKTCTVLMVIAVSFFGISWIARNIWVSILAILLVFLLAFVLLWRLINFANKNPQAVILEGAEFLVHQQIELAAKGTPSIPASINVVQATPVSLTGLTKEQLNEPDSNSESKDGEVSNG